MSLDSLLETCIFNSSSLLQYYLKYFNWVVQIVSFQNINVYEGSKRTHVLRVWDGHEITPALKHFCRFLSDDAEIIVPPAECFNGIPDSYFIDVLVFGEWITRASAIKSGSLVMLRNLHSYMGGRYKVPILTLHEGKSHGRDIIEIPPDVIGQHYRLIKLKNDIDNVILTHRKSSFDEVSNINSTVERSTLVEQNEECNRVELLETANVPSLST